VQCTNGDSDPRAKLKPEHLTRGRLLSAGDFPFSVDTSPALPDSVPE